VGHQAKGICRLKRGRSHAARAVVRREYFYCTRFFPPKEPSRTVATAMLVEACEEEGGDGAERARPKAQLVVTRESGPARLEM
jgi:hypothetical protein